MFTEYPWVLGFEKFVDFELLRTCSVHLHMINQIKTIGLLISGILVVAFLFWPTQNHIDDGKIHVRYWYATGQKEELPHSVKLFNQKQDSIVIEAVAIPWQESEKKILTAILSDNPPDIIDHFAPVVKWAARMGLYPLDKFIERDQFDSSIIFPANWQEMIWQDHVFAMPTATASYAMFYNKRIFREAGLDPEKPPRNWKEVKEYSKKLLRKNEKGQITQMGMIFYLGRTVKVSQQTEEPVLLMAWQKGIPFINNKREILEFANQQMVDLLNYIMDSRVDVSLEEQLAFTAGFGYGDQHGFTSERVAMMILPSNFPESIQRYKPDLDFGVCAIPTFRNRPTASSTATWWMAIPRGSNHPEAAWEFIKFVIEKETQLKTLAATKENLFPANRLAASDPRFLNKGYNSIFLDQLEFAHSTTIVPLAHDAFWREFTNALERAMHKEQEPMDALLQAQHLVQNELDRALKYDKYVRANMNFWEKN